MTEASTPARRATDELACTPESDQQSPVEAAGKQQVERYRPTRGRNEHHRRALPGKPRHLSPHRGGVRDDVFLTPLRREQVVER
jgi:hypothetical protein